MVEVRHIHYMSADHATKIHAMMWSPEGEVRGVLQIVHGMQEFAERYDDFARFMCGHGFAVAANDHLGHGDSVRSDEQYGYFAEKKGNRAVILDMRELQRKAQQEYPGVPYFMFGHSMGSFLVRQYICLYGKQVDGVILAGTAWYSAAEALLGMILCGIIARFKGWKYRSPLVTRISVGGYNQKFEPVRTQVGRLGVPPAVRRSRCDPPVRSASSRCDEVCPGRKDRHMPQWPGLPGREAVGIGERPIADPFPFQPVGG